MLDPLPDWPMFGLADDVRPALREARDLGAAMVLATLTKVEGGGPRPAAIGQALARLIADSLPLRPRSTS